MPPAARRRARTYDPDKTWAALTAQVEHVRAAVHALGPGEWERPTPLPGWDVRTLVAHIVRQIDAVRVLLAESDEAAEPGRPGQDVRSGQAPEPPASARPTTPAKPPAGKLTDLDTWALSTAGIADRLDASTKTAAASMGDPVAAVDAAAHALAAQRAEALRADRVLIHPFDGMRAPDFTVTRLVELVVHSDDLARATGTGIPLERQALAATVRLLADALAVKAPGNAVEVRIPPYAAVQCVPGPRHTRGTPPNVVETDPVTWIRLATGRTTWADALEAATVAASGERADLGPYLPVMS